MPRIRTLASTCGAVQWMLPGEPSEKRGAPLSSTIVLPSVERERAPGESQESIPEESCPSVECAPTIGTPPTTRPGMPPPWSVFIICTQFPWRSTIASSQLPLGWRDSAPRS